AIEAGRDQLLGRRVRQQVSGELLDGELVERLVAVERVDDVIAVRENAPDVTVELDPGPLARFRRSNRGRNDQSREGHDRTGRGAEAVPGPTLVGSCDRHDGILPDRRAARSACLWA